MLDGSTREYILKGIPSWALALLDMVNSPFLMEFVTRFTPGAQILYGWKKAPRHGKEYVLSQ